MKGFGGVVVNNFNPVKDGLTIAAHGESKPLYPNNTEHEENRRVEFLRVN